MAEIEDVDPPLPGVEKLEALITARGDDPALDNTVRHLVEGSVLYVLGHPTLEWVDVVHYEVRFGFEPISLVPVFTRYRFADEAILMNMSWLSLEASAVEARHVLADMQPHEWLAINPWSTATSSISRRGGGSGVGLVTGEAILVASPMDGSSGGEQPCVEDVPLPNPRSEDDSHSDTADQISVGRHHGRVPGQSEQLTGAVGDVPSGRVTPAPREGGGP